MKTITLTLLIVTHKTSSDAVKSIIRSFQHSRLKIYVQVVENGSTFIDPAEISQAVYVNYHRNISLAKIYNRAFHQTSSEFLLILDHDTLCLDSEDLYKALSQKPNILVPVVYSKQQVIYPLHSRELVSDFPTSLYNIRSIGSGLCLRKHKSLKTTSPFDERFFIYGVDTAFFAQHQSEQVSVGYSVSHDLSRLDGRTKSRWYYSERLKDALLQKILLRQNVKIHTLIKLFILGYNMKLIRELYMLVKLRKHPDA